MIHNCLNITLGPPGTGKTTRLLGIVETLLQSGIRPERIGFVSFTKKAAREAVERACHRFGLTEDRFPYFKTIHALTFRQLGLKPDQVMGRFHYRALGVKLGIDIRSDKGPTEDGLYGMQAGDRIVFLEGLARITGRPLRAVFDEANETEIDYRELDRYARALEAFKRADGLIDYTDMLEQFARSANVPTLDALIIDEAQDLSPAQWNALAPVAARCPVVYVAGDDDQAIYRWAGADVDAFICLDGASETLEQSFRIPLLVHEIAGKIVSQIKRRKPKTWKPRTERGAVSWYNDADEVDLSSGSWLLLARNGYLLDRLEELCRNQGFSYTTVGNNPLDGPAIKGIMAYERLRAGRGQTKTEVEAAFRYMSLARAPRVVRDRLKTHRGDKKIDMLTLVKWGFKPDAPIWHQWLDRISDSDREYFIAVRKRGETLTKTPRINISTIHTVKGGEADNVLLVTDMSNRTYEEMDRRLDDELRVWYVAVTRAKCGLHLIAPQTRTAFDLL